MEVQEIDIGLVKPYQNNPRKKGDKSVEKVANSIREFGFKQPIVVDEAMVVIVGHTRLEAAKALGLKTVPVVVASDLDPLKAKAYRIADNRVADDASWDSELLALELNDLRDLKYDMPLLGFEMGELRWRLDGVDAAEETDSDAEWVGMPEFDQQTNIAYRSIVIHLRDQAAVDAFAQTIDRQITPNTKYIWYPEIEIATYVDKRYVTTPPDPK